MSVLLRIVQWLAAIYCGVSFGVASGQNNPALGTVAGIIIFVLLLVSIGMLITIWERVARKYRDWQRYREYGR